MLLVNMFAKLILLSVNGISDLHATFAMADHPQHEELAAPTFSCQALGLFLEGLQSLSRSEGDVAASTLRHDDTK